MFLETSDEENFVLCHRRRRCSCIVVVVVAVVEDVVAVVEDVYSTEGNKTPPATESKFSLTCLVRTRKKVLSQHL